MAELQKPKIIRIETVAQSRLFTVQSVALKFSNGAERVYERMRPATRESVLIVPVVNNELILIREYAAGVDSYELGTAYGHIALSVDNAAEACERIRQNGGNVTREAGPVKGGTTVIAFVEDPDGYKIELIEEKDAGKGLGN